MNKLTSLVISLLWGVTAVAQTAKVDSSSMVTLRIDPENARGATVSQIFDEVEFIPLETTNESLFGKITQLKLTKSNYVIYDSDTKSVLIYTKAGKFVAKINAAMLKGDDESKEPTNFFGFRITGEEGKEQISISASKNIFFFDLNGKLIQKKLAKDYPPIRNHAFSDPNYSAKPSNLKVEGKDSTYYEISLFNKDKEIANYLPFSISRYRNDQFLGGSNSNTSGIYDFGVKNKLFYIRYYDYNIYTITPEKLSLTYRLIFPAVNSLPLDFTINEIYKGQKMSFIQKNSKVFYGVGDTYQFGNLLFFKMRSFAYDRSLKSSFIYDLKTGELTSIKDLEPDKLSFYLPITDAGANYDYHNYGMHLYNEGYLYTSYSSLAMFTFKEQSIGKNPQYSAVLTDYFKTQNRKSNPVLIRLKPKNVN